MFCKKCGTGEKDHATDPEVENSSEAYVQKFFDSAMKADDSESAF